MKLNELSEYAISYSRWDHSVIGYVRYTDTFAARADVIKALASEDSFFDASVKMWFSVGYLKALSNCGPPEKTVNLALTDDEFDGLRDLLIWLKPLHDNSFDNGGVDTTNVLSAFSSYGEAALEGQQFRLSVPTLINGKILFPDLYNNPLPLSAEQVKTETLQAKEKIYKIAQALGNLHRASNLG